jgi:molecular chaperone DnaJ
MGLYEKLGLERGADAQEIRRAYLKLTKTAHPDKGGSEEEFKQIQQAYEVLSDDDKRAFYDQTGQVQGEESQGSNGGGGFPFPFDLGAMFGMGGGGPFGGGGMPFGMGGNPGGRQQRRPKAPTKVHDIGLTLHDYFYGKRVQLKFERQKFCETCKGDGAETYETCKVCNGAGARMQQIMIGPGMMATSRAQCGPCGGDGKQVKKVCTKCNGLKFKTHEKVLVAIIEPGMKAGDVLKFPNECSDQHEYEEAGDVHIVMREADESSPLKRSGDDLKGVLNIPFTTSLLGGKEVLQGHPAHPGGLTVTVPVGSMRGDVIQVVGEGMPKRGGGAMKERGNLFLTLGVDVKDAEKAVLTKNLDLLRGLF